MITNDDIIDKFIDKLQRSRSFDAAVLHVGWKCYLQGAEDTKTNHAVMPESLLNEAERQAMGRATGNGPRYGSSTGASYVGC